MKFKIVESNSKTLLVYGVVSLVAICFSFLGFLHKGFEFYALVVTSIAFIFGGLYLFLMLKSIKIESDASAENPKLLKMFLSNFVRFLVIASGIVLSFVFIRFCPVKAGYTFEKSLYLYALICVIPSPICIGLFYLRSKYIA